MVIDISKITLDNLSKYESNKIKRCIICGREFEATRRDKEVCSSKCCSTNNYRKRKLNNNKRA